MKPYYILKIILVLIGFLTPMVNIIESIYVYLFSKPIFIHLYFVKKKLPKQSKLFLEKNIKFYGKLSDTYKSYYEHRLATFIRNYDFIERDGVKITPEMKVLIASSYIKLTFGMRKYLTEIFNKIVIYPNVYYSLMTKQHHKGEFNPGLKTIIFSWEDFLLGDLITNDNINLGIHEFTHALTFHGLKANDASARVFYKTFKEIISFFRDEKNKSNLEKSNYFREYGMTNQMEFVAVIMEHFLESPKELQQQFPELYHKIVTMLNYRSILNQQSS